MRPFSELNWTLSGFSSVQLSSERAKKFVYFSDDMFEEWEHSTKWFQKDKEKKEKEKTEQKSQVVQ